MFILISYDIHDNRRRTRVMKTLQDYGTRVQYSVFECNLQSAQLQKLKERLRRLMAGRVHPEDLDDSIRFYYLNALEVSRVEVLGGGRVTQDPVFYMH